MTLIFDFDGTLCDSLAVTLAIINKYFHLFHIPPVTEAELRKVGLKTMLTTRHIPSLAAIIGYPIAHWEFTQRLPDMHLFTWTTTIIPQLAQNHTLGILTNNSTSVVTQVLKKHGLFEHFTFIQSQPSLFAKQSSLTNILAQHHLALPDTYYVGDGIRDIEAANNIGMKSIGVAWGLESDELLASAKPTHLISNPSDLLHLKL